MYKRNKVREAVMLALSTSAISVTATAAEFEEITVTATKREESLQDVPIAVTALTGEALEELGITNFSDYVSWRCINHAKPDNGRRCGPCAKCRVLPRRAAAGTAWS
jgi:hypothetical protein